MELQQARNILERLEPVLNEQGLGFSILEVDQGVVRLRARRLAPGANVGFAVRAVAGTFRRYLPGFREIFLEALEDTPREAALVAPVGPGFRGLPGLDLTDLDRRQAASALDNFAALARRRGDTHFRLLGLDQEGPVQAARQWCALNLGAATWRHAEKGRGDAWIVHLAGPCHDPDTCGAGEEGETVPARILLVDQA